jgi:hypothetical protein
MPASNALKRRSYPRSQFTQPVFRAPFRSPVETAVEVDLLSHESNRRFDLSDQQLLERQKKIQDEVRRSLEKCGKTLNDIEELSIVYLNTPTATSKSSSEAETAWRHTQNVLNLTVQSLEGILPEDKIRILHEIRLGRYNMDRSSRFLGYDYQLLPRPATILANLTSPQFFDVVDVVNKPSQRQRSRLKGRPEYRHFFHAPNGSFKPVIIIDDVGIFMTSAIEMINIVEANGGTVLAVVNDHTIYGNSLKQKSVPAFSKAAQKRIVKDGRFVTGRLPWLGELLSVMSKREGLQISECDALAKLQESMRGMRKLLVGKPTRRGIDLTALTEAEIVGIGRYLVGSVELYETCQRLKLPFEALKKLDFSDVVACLQGTKEACKYVRAFTSVASRVSAEAKELLIDQLKEAPQSGRGGLHGLGGLYDIMSRRFGS